HQPRYSLGIVSNSEDIVGYGDFEPDGVRNSSRHDHDVAERPFLRFVILYRTRNARATDFSEAPRVCIAQGRILEFASEQGRAFASNHIVKLVDLRVIEARRR